MSTTTPVTALQLLHLPDDGNRYELIAGELRMMSPSGWKRGRVVGILHGLLWQHVRKHDLGIVFGAETGFLISRNPDTVRVPDVAFIARKNLPDEEPQEGYWPGPPDLAVEVLSPSDRKGDMDEKTGAWLGAGAACVWVVDPKLKTVTICRSVEDVTVRSEGQQLDGEAVVPEFSCPVTDIFTSRA